MKQINWLHAFTSYRVFLKKRGLERVSLPHFCLIFEEKYFSILYSINWSNIIVWFPLLREILGNMFIVIICFSVNDVINFESTVDFLSSCFPTWPKRRQDNNIVLIWSAALLKNKFEVIGFFANSAVLGKGKQESNHWSVYHH